MNDSCGLTVITSMVMEYLCVKMAGMILQRRLMVPIQTMIREKDAGPRTIQIIQPTEKMLLFKR